MTDHDDPKEQPDASTPQGSDAQARPAASESGASASAPKPEAQTEPKGKRPEPRKPGKPHTKGRGNGGGGRWFLWLLVLVIVALPLAGGYGAWLVWERVQNQSAQLGDLDARLSEQRQALEQQSQTLDNLPDTRNLERDLRSSLQEQLQERLQEERREQATTLEQMEQRLNRVDRRLSAIASTDREDWKLAEAEYLLRVANQRLVLERDSRNALALAQTADGILRDLDDPDLLPVRRALTRDIQALRLAGRADREGLYLQLLALGEQLPELPLVEPLETRAPGTPDADTDTEDSETPAEPRAWERVKQSFTGILNRLGDHIRIRRHDEPLAALADPREQFFLRQQLQLMLEQAQAALLREETTIYQASLNRAADWLEQHYRLNEQTTDAIATLRDLAETEIAPQLPELTEALNLLEEHIRRLQRLSPEFQGPRADDEESEQ